jgi:hypothetical protein
MEARLANSLISFVCFPLPNCLAADTCPDGITSERSIRLSWFATRPAVRRDGATDGGSHDPSRVEPQVVAMKKSIPGKTPKEAMSEESGSGRGDSGLRGLLDGRFGADHPLGEEMYSVGRKCVYVFNRRMAKKSIPVEARGRLAYDSA